LQIVAARKIRLQFGDYVEATASDTDVTMRSRTPMPISNLTEPGHHIYHN
jgi:hypothetical protein